MHFEALQIFCDVVRHQSFSMGASVNAVSQSAASQAIRDGEVVCIFAEGQITRTGQMLPFRRGYEKIMKAVDAPDIDVTVKKED